MVMRHHNFAVTALYPVVFVATVSKMVGTKLEIVSKLINRSN